MEWCSNDLIEGRVAATLYDLIDPDDDTYDMEDEDETGVLSDNVELSFNDIADEVSEGHDWFPWFFGAFYDRNEVDCDYLRVFELNKIYFDFDDWEDIDLEILNNIPDMIIDEPMEGIIDLRDYVDDGDGIDDECKETFAFTLESVSDENCGATIYAGILTFDPIESCISNITIRCTDGFREDYASFSVTIVCNEWLLTREPYDPSPEFDFEIIGDEPGEGIRVSIDHDGDDGEDEWDDITEMKLKYSFCEPIRIDESLVFFWKQYNSDNYCPKELKSLS